MVKLKRYIFSFIGLIFLVIAYFGIITPGIPGIPFILLAAWCFIQSSDSLYQWMLRRKYLGRIIRKYFSNENVSKGAIWFVISQLWLSVIIAVFVFPLSPLFIGIVIASGIICSIVIYRLLSTKSPS